MSNAPIVPYNLEAIQPRTWVKLSKKELRELEEQRTKRAINLDRPPVKPSKTS